MAQRLLILTFALLLSACPDKPAGKTTEKTAVATPDAGAAPTGPVTLTLLVTGSENGYLLANPDDSGVSRGGAAEMLGRWVKDYGHCPGKLKDGAPACGNDDATLALSTGDNFNGASISSFFEGTPAAEAMGQMGYAASAFGNRELDFGKEGFLANRRSSGIVYLAANLKEAASDKPLKLESLHTFERKGVKVAVIGLTARKTLKTVMPGRSEGLELTDFEQVVTEQTSHAWSQGPSAVVLLSDDCLADLKPMLEKHTEWRLSVAAGRQCETEVGDKVGNTVLVYPGRHFNTFAAVKLTFDLSKPAIDRLTAASSETVEVVNDEKAPKPEPSLVKLLDGWKERRDKVLGEQIGFTKAGIGQTSDLMTRWIANALRTPAGADIGLINRKGIRQSLPAGSITRASVYDVIPFENSVVVATVEGVDLLPMLDNPEARVTGATKKGKGWVDAKGAKIDPKRKYTVATTDYLYFGGDGFDIEKRDTAPNFTSELWQTQLIDATVHAKSDEKKPLEVVLKETK